MSYQLRPNDLIDREREALNQVVTSAGPGGRNHETDLRLAVNAIFWGIRTGCYLPKEYPSWQEAPDILVRPFGQNQRS
ncbi:MAG TPA: transposase [Blastocatellia bacterium]|nr:transposase [Blastocatellia bacterium]